VYAARKNLINDKFYKSFDEIHRLLHKGEEVTVAIDILIEGRWNCEGYKVIGKDKDGICWVQRSISHEW
jgi:hypothetical protein